MASVPRVSVERRLESLAAAATLVFGRLGYRGARVADVAAEAGMSSGSVFNYVESKEALFHLVFARAFDTFAKTVSQIPMPTPLPGETAALIERHLRAIPAP